MRAKEAPKKIWMSDDTEAIWVTNPCSTRFIEYTRTDALIEKACKFLDKELPITDLSSSNMLDITFKVFDKENKKVFIENFKKYIERK